MTIRIVRLGTERSRGEGLRIGTVRRPPRGVPKNEYASQNWYDVWLPNVAPTPELMKIGQAAESEKAWAAFVKKYRAEMANPEKSRILDLLAALSHHVNLSVGCYCENRAPLSPVHTARALGGAGSQTGTHLKNSLIAHGRVMISRIDAFLKERSSLQVTTACLLLILVLAAVDHTTGYELSFSIFYLLPIAFATWYAGLYHGALLSIVSASVWLIVDITAGNHYSRSFIPFWNAGVRFLFFIVTAWLLTTVRAQLEKERSMARLDGLTGVMNGLAFTESAQTILRIADRFERPTAIGYIDLDNFKSVNDTLGHAEGDQVLKSGRFRFIDLGSQGRPRGSSGWG